MARAKFLFLEPYFRPGSPLAIQTELVIKNLEEKQKALVSYRGPLTFSQFQAEIQQWGIDPYKRHSVLLLSSHGEPGKIFVGDCTITLKHLARLLDGNAANRHIHFFSCLTLGIEKSEIYKFMNDVNCFSVSGYAYPVGLFNGTPVEMKIATHLAKFSPTHFWRKRVNSDFKGFENEDCRSTGLRFLFRDEG